MTILKSQFLQSNTDYRKCPKADKPEYAFIGRSNVGKSSLINLLTDNSKLAKVSGKPGKTRLINHFIINDHWYLVDLPGYGFAKISKDERENWDKMNKEYLQYRENLLCVFVLIDSRIEPQKIDLEFLNWLGKQEIPFAIVFTKTDKQTLNKTNTNISAFEKEMLKSWEALPQVFRSSAVSGTGNKEILGYIEQLNQDFLTLAK